jgi:hypothetical protein
MACSAYDQFLSQGRLLTDRLMVQGFLPSRLMSAFRKSYGLYNELVYNNKLSVSQMLSDILYTNSNAVRSWHTDFDGGSLRILDLKTEITAGVTDQQGMLTPPRHLIPLPVYPGVLVRPFISLICNSYLCFEPDHCLIYLTHTLIQCFWCLVGKFLNKRNKSKQCINISFLVSEKGFYLLLQKIS